MQNLSITTIQSTLFWEDIDANLNMFDKKLGSIEQTDIIVLPEMFTTGFTMNSAQFAEKIDGKTVSWMLNKAKEKDACIVGSVIIEENNKYYNKLIWAFPDGTFKSYNKRHLFRMANEHEYYSEGTELLTLECKNWKICPLICYDLRFPVWSRNTKDIDLYIYVANWPHARVTAWNKLLEARAIENLAYVVGVNRVGEDGKGIKYSGNSTITDFKGDNICKHESFQESVLTTTLSKQKLVDFRTKFPAHLDADKFNLLNS